MKGLIIQSNYNTAIDIIYNTGKKAQGHKDVTLYNCTSDKSKLYELGNIQDKQGFSIKFDNEKAIMGNKVARIIEGYNNAGFNRDIVIESTLRNILNTSKMEVEINYDEKNNFIMVWGRLGGIALEYSKSLIVRGNSSLLVSVVIALYADGRPHNTQSTLYDKYSECISTKAFVMDSEEIKAMAKRMYLDKISEYNKGVKPKKSANIFYTTENVKDSGIDLTTTIEEESKITGLSKENIERLHRRNGIVSNNKSNNTVSSNAVCDVESLVIKSYTSREKSGESKATVYIISDVSKLSNGKFNPTESEAEKIIRRFLSNRRKQ